MLYSEVERELAHYGVKGMKWGVRKDRPESGIETKSKKATAKKIALGVAFVAGAAALGYGAHKIGVQRSFMSRPVFSLKDNAEVLEKGHQFFRQSSSLETKLIRRAYAFSDPNHRGSFRGAHEVILTAREQVRVASPKQARDTLATIVDRKAFVRDRRTVTGKIAAMTMTREGIANATLTSIQTSWWKSPQAEALMRRLYELGYGAVTDPVMGGSAKILFGETLYDVVTLRK